MSFIFLYIIQFDLNWTLYLYKADTKDILVILVDIHLNCKYLSCNKN